ncbi:hypothetical protein J6590_006404 [Homalodisca vitripennis]|nr:hypothetical protein J6590_006404 [Homalodisca vitripennis]
MKTVSDIVESHGTENRMNIIDEIPLTRPSSGRRYEGGAAVSQLFGFACEQSTVVRPLVGGGGEKGGFCEGSLLVLFLFGMEFDTASTQFDAKKE